MAKHHGTTDFPPGVWVMLTTEDVVAIRAQNVTYNDVWLQRGTTVEPGSIDGAVLLLRGWGVAAHFTLDEWWPGADGGRIWGFAPAGGKVSCSHA
ncbi:hypothetical protein [Aquicoccus sp. SU-CL01552]|uniref:hypothetical protein n=1 Tax=Aquicoccus sp. SU-CL01552 TaxID=3127656 RepID=UPI00310BC731